jgi:hypothetical protein
MGLGLLGPSIVFLSHFPSFFIPFSISLFFFRFHFISFVPFCPPFVSFAFFHSPFVFSLFLIALFTPLIFFGFLISLSFLSFPFLIFLFVPYCSTFASFIPFRSSSFLSFHSLPLPLCFFSFSFTLSSFFSFPFFYFILFLFPFVSFVPFHYPFIPFVSPLFLSSLIVQFNP